MNIYAVISIIHTRLYTRMYMYSGNPAHIHKTKTKQNITTLVLRSGYIHSIIRYGNLDDTLVISAKAQVHRIVFI